jgi:hypothetical protein
MALTKIDRNVVTKRETWVLAYLRLRVAASERSTPNRQGQVLAAQRPSPPRENLAQFAMVKETRKLGAPNQRSRSWRPALQSPLASRGIRESS